MKAVIFDMDGVIIDSEPVHFEVEQALIEKLGGKLETQEHEKFVGTTDYYMWNKLKNKFDFEPSVEEIIEMKKQMFLEKIDQIKLMNNCKKLIVNLYKKGYPLAIASSNNRITVDKVIKKFDLGKYMKFVISGEEVNEGKPNPEIFLTAAKKMHILPEDCLVIEDAHNGVKAAKAAGMKCVGLKNLEHGNQNLTESDLIVNSLDELNLTTLKELFSQ